MKRGLGGAKVSPQGPPHDNAGRLVPGSGYCGQQFGAALINDPPNARLSQRRAFSRNPGSRSGHGLLRSVYTDGNALHGNLRLVVKPEC
jgi:hypothetical protein